MRAKGEEKHKVMAYLLNVEFGYTMTAIAQLMQVTQPTISNWIKEAGMQIRINALTQELAEARNEIARLGLTPQNIQIDYDESIITSCKE